MQLIMASVLSLVLRTENMKELGFMLVYFWRKRSYYWSKMMSDYCFYSGYGQYIGVKRCSPMSLVCNS